MRYDILWGNTYPVCATGLTPSEAQALINDLDDRGVSYTVTESAHVAA